MPHHTDHRDRIRAYLRDSMAAAELLPGDKVNLPTVARALGLSVTPVRETLTQLAYSGILEVRPLRGFFVPALSAGDAQLCYHAVVALETEALRIDPPDDAARLGALADAHAVFAQADTPPARLAADAGFHDLLLAPYRDTGVGQVLADLKTRILFYERAFLAEAELHGQSVALHAAIVEALGGGDVPTAAGALRRNWLNVAAVLYPRIPEPHSADR